MAIECEHGSLARSCLICELQERIRELEQENARLKQEMEQWRMIALTK